MNENTEVLLMSFITASNMLNNTYLIELLLELNKIMYFMGLMFVLPLVLQNMTLFGDGIFTDVIKLKWDHQGGT